jgi:hypothetical protein
MNAFDATVLALIPAWPDLDPALRAAVAIRCGALVRRQIRLAPLPVRAGIATLFAAFRCYSLLRAGRNPSVTARAGALAAFSRLPLPLVPRLERVLKSMTSLFYFEQPEVVSALNDEMGDCADEAAGSWRRATRLAERFVQSARP